MDFHGKNSNYDHPGNQRGQQHVHLRGWKKDEAGLIDWAKENKVRTHFFANEIMQKMIEKYNLQQSPFVQKQIGIGNVCEAAILSYNEKAKIILPKTKFEKVTVSLAWE